MPTAPSKEAVKYKSSKECIETARLSLTLARQEILFRLSHRDNLIFGYLFAAVSFFGVVVSKSVDDPQSRILLGFLGPLSSMIVSIIAYQYTQAMEELAGLIRYQINPYLIQLHAWAPHWDWHTRENDKWSETIDGKKTRRRLILELVALHTVSILSFLYSSNLILDQWPLVPAASLNPTLIKFAWLAALIFLVVAITFTCLPYWARKKQFVKLGKIATPDGYQDFMAVPKKEDPRQKSQATGSGGVNETKL